MAPKEKRAQTDNMHDTARPRRAQTGSPPEKTVPEPQEQTTTPYLKGKAGLSYEDQQKYAPRGPFQSAISLNLDSIRAQPDGFFADLYGLRVNALLLQDYRRTGDGTRSFLINASQKVFRGKRQYCAAFSDLLPTQDGRLYGGGRGYGPPPLHGTGSC